MALFKTFVAFPETSFVFLSAMLSATVSILDDFCNPIILNSYSKITMNCMYTWHGVLRDLLGPTTKVRFLFFIFVLITILESCNSYFLQ